MMIRVVTSANKPMTRAEICAAVGRKKVPHLVRMICELADAGVISEALAFRPNGMHQFVYSARR